jgi:hypothetical protein
MEHYSGTPNAIEESAWCVLEEREKPGHVALPVIY